MGLIYKHTNTISDKAYIGQTTRSMEVRWDDHLYDSERWDNKFSRALKKYGSNCWTHEVIAEYDDEILNEAEVYWISYFDTFHNGYNSTTGGDSNYMVSEMTKKKMSENHADVKGINHPMFGKHHTEESKELMCINRSGKPAWNKGIPHSQQTLDNIIASNPRRFTGKQHSDETKQRMADARRKYWENKHNNIQS